MSTLTRMEIQTVVVGGLQMPSLIVLRTSPAADAPEIRLPIRIGPVEAAAISAAVDDRGGHRPLTHDLMVDIVKSLDARVSAVHIVDVEGTTFYATLLLTRADGTTAKVDCRPSDAIALAVRVGAPIFAYDSVLATATMPDFQKVERDAEEQELAAFHDFVEGLNPEDFS